MKSSSDIHEELSAKYERELAGLKSYIKELKDRTAEHGTPAEHFDEDLLEAEHNTKYYEDEIARIKKESGGGGRAECDTILPRTAKQGIGSLIISSISFVAGAILGSRLKSRRGEKDRGRDRKAADESPGPGGFGFGVK